MGHLELGASARCCHPGGGGSVRILPSLNRPSTSVTVYGLLLIISPTARLSSMARTVSTRIWYASTNCCPASSAFLWRRPRHADQSAIPNAMTAAATVPIAVKTSVQLGLIITGITAVIVAERNVITARYVALV